MIENHANIHNYFINRSTFSLLRIDNCSTIPKLKMKRLFQQQVCRNGHKSQLHLTIPAPSTFHLPTKKRGP